MQHFIRLFSCFAIFLAASQAHSASKGSGVSDGMRDALCAAVNCYGSEALAGSPEDYSTMQNYEYICEDQLLDSAKKIGKDAAQKAYWDYKKQINSWPDKKLAKLIKACKY